MGAYKSAIITTAGQNLIAQALAGSSAVKFTALKTSNYSYPASTNFEALTSLQGVKQSTGITSAIVVNQTTVKISARVSNVGIASAYYINTIGVYAETDGITETLIAVIPASTADLVPAFTTGAPYSFIYDINLTIQNSSSLNVTINDSGVATVADLEHFYEKSYDVYVSDTASGAVASFEDGANKIPMESVNVNMSLSQSFNGYDKPWAPGSGKNLLPMTVDGIKAANTGGTWSGNSFTQNGITFTILTDNAGNVTGILANGTNTSNRNAALYLYINDSFYLPNGDYILSGGYSDGCRIFFYNGNVYYDSKPAAVSFTIDGTETASNCVCSVPKNTTVNDAVLYPMIRLATETDDTFAPYSNICPISGQNEVRITRTGKNLFPYPYSETTKTANGITFTDNGDGTISASGTASASAQFNAYTRVNNPFTLLVGTYIISGCPNGGSSSTYEIAINDMVNGANHIVCHDYGAGATFEVTDATHLYGLYIMVRAGQTVDFTFKPMIRLAAESDATFEPYTSKIATANLGQTVYGGTLDLVSGSLTITDANITSYAGEALPGEWLSSYDKYAEGATPTTGAQVVYKLATPQTAQLEPSQIDSLYGYNNVWSDVGNVDVKYRADTTLYINKKIAEMQALILENS